MPGADPPETIGKDKRDGMYVPACVECLKKKKNTTEMYISKDYIQ